jgi:hypothetical protein
VLDEIESLAEKFQAEIEEEDETYKELSLCELLDLSKKIHVVNYRQPKWSAIASDLCCGCVTCLQWKVCGHNTLHAMCFDPTLTVPTKWEQSSPSLRMVRGRRDLPGVGKGRGIAGGKRLRSEKKIEQDKKTGVKTACPALPHESYWPLCQGTGTVDPPSPHFLSLLD